MSRRIRQISITKFEDQMYEKMEMESSEQVKMRAERELEMTTDLLVGAGVKEPQILKFKTSIILKGYLLMCTVLNLITMLAVSGRLQAIYLVKSLFTAFGVYSVSKRDSRMNLIFTGLFGVSVLMESIPCVAGMLLLFSGDVCSILAGISGGQVENNEEFLQFCRKNIETVRFMGSAVIVTEVLLDTLMFVQMVHYQKYLKRIESERTSLNYYTGKERIAIP